MKRSLRITGYVLLGVLATLLLLVAVYLVLTRTEYGLERVRDFAVAQIEDEMEGELRVGRITTPGILGRARLYDVAIDDPDGRPFFRAERVELSYDWRILLGGQFVFERVEVADAEAYITRLPGDTAWNYEYVFPDPTPEIEEPDPLILFEHAVVHNSLIEVRYPWEPDERPVEPDDTARLVLEPAGDGTVRVLRFEEIDGVLPRVLWSTPTEEGRLLRVAELSTRGFIWRDPFQLVDLEGTVTVRDSLIAFDTPVLRMPASTGSAVGRVITEVDEDGDDDQAYDVRIEGDDIAFADLQWFYPRLPDEGGGSLVFRISTLAPGRTLWLAENARLRAPGTEIAGDFGIVTGDTLYFTRVDLRAAPLDIELVEQVVPADLPIEGLMIGTVEVEGPLSSLQTTGELRIVGRGASAGTAELTWDGTVDARRGLPRDLTAEVSRADPPILAALRPGWRPEGAWSGRIRLRDPGDDDPSVRLAATIRNVLDDATGTDFEIEGTVLRSTERGPSLDLTVHTPSFALSALSAFVPGADALQGEVGGDVRLRGPADELQVDADLDTPGGPLELWATLDLTDSLSGYHVEARFTDYDPGRLLDRGPTMALTGTFDLAGAGDAFGEGRGAVRVSLDSGVVGSLPFDAALAELRFDDGLLRVDTLTAVRSGARLDAHGEFGLLAERSGRLDLTLRADSLGALRSDATRDPVLVPDDEGDGESPVDTVALAGAVELRGWLDGSIASFRAGADAEARELRYGSSAVARAAATLDARADGPEGADELRATLRLTGEGLRVGAGALDSADVTATLAPDGGTVEVDARGPADREYRLAGEFDRSADTTAITVDRFHIASPRGAWTLVRPVPVRLGPAALDIDDARLARSDGAARLAMDGTLPAVLVPGDRLARERQPVDFRVTAEDVPIGEVLHLAQLDTAAAGTLHGGVTVRGTAGDPRIAGETRVEGLRLDSLTVRSATTSFDYASRRLEARLAVEQDDRRILDGTGSIPLDLALLPVEERRLDEPLEFAVRADRVPAALIASLIPGAAAVEGEIDGELSVGGTARDPVLAGELAVDRAAATWTPTGIRYRDVSGTFRVLGERLVGVRLSARAAQGDGSAQLEGTITVPSLDDPNFDLALVMRDFPAVRRPEVDAVASGRIQLAGRYRRPVVTGRISVTRGALHLDRIVRNRRVVELEDPLLPAVLDSGGVAVDQVVPVAERSPFLQNLVLEDATVAVSSDFWLRGRNMNVELVGDLNVTYDRRGEDLRLSGILNAVRGSYQLRVTNVYTRRFTVNEGTVEFVGTPEMDPNLDLTGEYRVRTRGGSPLDIFVQVSGTLREPRIRLTSDAEPPISESELVSYLLFGRPTFALEPGESRAFDQLGVSLGLDAGLPVFGGWLASGLETALGLDYLAISGADIAGEPVGSGSDDPFDAFGAEVELGYYLAPELFVALIGRIGRTGIGGQTDEAGLPGVRVEWRFRPTWMLEFFLEDRFARSPSFGAEAVLERREAAGFFLAREWGY